LLPVLVERLERLLLASKLESPLELAQVLRPVLELLGPLAL
jgi:hypothetical protein